MQKNINKKLSKKKNNNYILSDDTLVIIPAFNEEKRIKSTIKSLQKYFKNITLINDGSNDATLKNTENLQIRIINHPINLGQGAALDTGLQYFLSYKKFKYAITFDADGQHDSYEAFRMLLLAKKGNFSAVLGSRFLEKKNSQKVPFLKKNILKLAIFYERIFYRIKLTDAHNGLRVFRRDLVLEDILPISNYDMSHATEISQKITRSRKNFIEYSVHISYDKKKSQAPLNAINIIVKNSFQPK